MTQGPSLFTRELGRGHRLLAFLPGLANTTRYWETRVTALADHNRLLLVDPLGFGQSPKPWTTYSVERHVAEVRRVLSGRGPVTLVGHSFGAILAMAYANRHPDDVRGLVLIGLPVFHGEIEAKHFVRRRPSPERWVLGNMLLASLACVLTRRLFRHVIPGLVSDFPREVTDDLVLHTWRSSTSTLWEAIYRFDVFRTADALPRQLPVLLLHGTLDETAPLTGVQELIRPHPDWTLRILEGGDHHPLLRDPAWTLAAIRDFLTATDIE
ncbi:MAG: alpha/beta fold hydrolase [Gemmatimonadaceae bacterium]